MNNLSIHITKLEKEEQSISKVSRITAIKIIEKSMKLTTSNQQKESIKYKTDSLKRSIKFVNLQPGQLRKREDIDI